jgi:integrase/recombinase XerD
MYTCGLHISEAATLQVTAIDGINGFVRVIGKGNKERCVPLPQPVLTELRRFGRRIATGVGCPTRDGTGPISRHALWLTFRKVAREAGIRKRVSPHSIRGNPG